MPTVRVALYVANVGKNLHFLREPRVKHVFIGHGESDKVASVNPFTKVYDEIWVAGRISRQRWAAAEVGVRDETVVEVGGPQLAEVLPAGERPPGRPLTVLYAPTWEGWTANPFASSLPTMGPALVRWLLERPAPDPGGLQAAPPHRHGVAGRQGGAPRDRGADRGPRRPARRGLHRCRWTPPVTPRTSPCRREEVESYEVWAGAYWSRTSAHLVVEGPRPTLYDCFNHADLLVSDISSVVPDFVASGKPYVVTNAADEPHEQIRAPVRQHVRGVPGRSRPDLLGADARADRDGRPDGAAAGPAAHRPAGAAAGPPGRPLERGPGGPDPAGPGCSGRTPSWRARRTSTRDHRRRAPRDLRPAPAPAGPAQLPPQHPPARERRGGGQHHVGDGEQHP